MNTFQAALKAYLDEDGNAESALAEKVGRSQAAINRYRCGKRFPDADTARLIEKHTSGAVPFSAWQADFLVRSGLTGALPEKVV
jgi:transcriptional regulator with XRE-family HTH domain